MRRTSQPAQSDRVVTLTFGVNGAVGTEELLVLLEAAVSDHDQAALRRLAGTLHTVSEHHCGGYR